MIASWVAFAAGAAAGCSVASAVESAAGAFGARLGSRQRPSPGGGALMAFGVACAFLVGGVPAAAVAGVGAFAVSKVSVAVGRRRRRQRAESAAGSVAGSVAAALAAGLRPTDALELACRHRSDPLSREVRSACAEVAAGLPLEGLFARMRSEFATPTVLSLCTALESATERGTSAREQVASIARTARSRDAVSRKERAARSAPAIQLVVAFGLVPAALLIVGACVVAQLGA